MKKYIDYIVVMLLIVPVSIRENSKQNIQANHAPKQALFVSAQNENIFIQPLLHNGLDSTLIADAQTVLPKF